MTQVLANFRGYDGFRVDTEFILAEIQNQMTWILAIFIGIFAIFTVPCSSIQCWNCVGSDCNSYRSSSPMWEVMECPEGSVCQKTDFVFYSNQKNMSIEAYTVRSCSYENGCTWDRSKSCLKNPVEQAGRGCVDRYCCGRDKCNGSGVVEGFFTVVMLATVFGMRLVF